MMSALEVLYDRLFMEKRKVAPLEEEEHDVQERQKKAFNFVGAHLAAAEQALG